MYESRISRDFSSLVVTARHLRRSIFHQTKQHRRNSRIKIVFDLDYLNIFTNVFKTIAKQVNQVVDEFAIFILYMINYWGWLLMNLFSWYVYDKA